MLASILSPLLVKGVVEVYTMSSACSKLPYPIYAETDIKINKDLAVGVFRNEQGDPEFFMEVTKDGKGIKAIIV